MDALAHPLSNEELRSLWLVCGFILVLSLIAPQFYSSQHPRDSTTQVLTIEDLSRLLQSIREQDVFRTDIAPLENDFISFVMEGYLRPSVKVKETSVLMWPEFSTNFNSYWTKRKDIYENWKSNNVLGLPQPMTAVGISASRPSPIRPTVPGAVVGNMRPSAPEDVASLRVLEAELVEVSERLRQTRYQLDEERQKRHQLRDDLDESKRKAEDERMRYLEATKQLVILEEDKLTHEVQVSRIREQLEQNISMKETLQLDVDRVRMQLNHAKEKYETALKSAVADNEALRKKIEVLTLEITQNASNGAKKEMTELESQNAVLRQIVERYRKAFPASRFADTIDAASGAAFDSPKLATASDFLNSLMEALDKAKFLNKQMTDATNSNNIQIWKDLSLGWKETVCELCDLFAAAHRIESQTGKTKPSG